jgi:hypothetical protein
MIVEMAEYRKSTGFCLALSYTNHSLENIVSCSNLANVKQLEREKRVKALISKE